MIIYINYNYNYSLKWCIFFYIYLMYKMKKTIIDYRYSKDKNHTMFW